MCVMKVSNSMQNFIKKDGSIPDLYNNIYPKMSQVQRFGGILNIKSFSNGQKTINLIT